MSNETPIPLSKTATLSAQAISANNLAVAGIAPLVEGSRVEYVITYRSLDWIELADVLEAPLEYFRSRQYLWTQLTDATHIAWEMLAPVTVVLKPWSLDFNTALTSLAYMTASQVGTGHHGPWFPPANNITAQGIVGALGGTLGTNPYPCGAFVARFAIYTSKLEITYFPPTAKGCTLYPALSPAGVDAVFLVETEGTGQVGLDLHFDLPTLEPGRLYPSQRETAAFLMSHIQDKQWLPKVLTRKAGAGQIKHMIIKATPPGDWTSPVNAALKNPNVRVLNEATQFFAEMPTAEPSALEDGWHGWPLVVSTGHSDTSGPGCPSCSNLAVVALASTWATEPVPPLYLGATNAQRYHLSQIDPQRIVEDAGRLLKKK